MSVQRQHSGQRRRNHKHGSSSRTPAHPHTPTPAHPHSNTHPTNQQHHTAHSITATAQRFKQHHIASHSTTAD